ncbi:MAG: flagellin [Candidatus Eremiobacteraeota bacterium]|nr:flagellin [Candidatus Eremiobacteraeota bacterium]
MDVLGSASFILQNEALTQNRLATDVNALASGLRVNSASDDPSGYTIHETIDTKVAGLQQSVTNVQTANNLLNVAEAALSNVESILQRIRSLVVEANSDVNSQGDLQNIQAEIDQLLLEINRIGENTTFNGLPLFNGQFQANSTFQSQFLRVFQETPPYPNLAGATGSNTLANGNGPGVPGSFVDYPPLPLVAAPGFGGYVPAFTVFTIVSASNNMIDPDSGTNVGPGVLIEQQSYSVSGGSFGPTPLFVDYSALPDSGVNGIPVNIQAPSGHPPTFSTYNLLNIAFGGPAGSFSPQDVGAQFAILTENPVQPSTGNALQVNDGGDEGTLTSISLPQLSTLTLGISNIDVTDQLVSGVQQNGSQQIQLQGVSSSNVMNASYAELVVDQALEQINTNRAQIGAQTVSLQQDASNDNVAIVNLTATSSNIRDANIGATATDFTKNQILVNVGNSVLAQVEVSATQLTALLLNSFSGLGAAQGAPTTSTTGTGGG